MPVFQWRRFLDLRFAAPFNRGTFPIFIDLLRYLDLPSCRASAVWSRPTCSRHRISGSRSGGLGMHRLDHDQVLRCCVTMANWRSSARKRSRPTQAKTGRFLEPVATPLPLPGWPSPVPRPASPLDAGTTSVKAGACQPCERYMRPHVSLNGTLILEFDRAGTAPVKPGEFHLAKRVRVAAVRAFSHATSQHDKPRLQQSDDARL